MWGLVRLVIMLWPMVMWLRKRRGKQGLLERLFQR